MKYTSSNPDVAVVENNNIIAKSKGETTITVHNKEYSKTFVVNVTEALKSPIYDIDNENKIIFVNKMTELRLRKEVFISNIQKPVGCHDLPGVPLPAAGEGSAVGLHDFAGQMPGLFTFSHVPSFRGQREGEGGHAAFAGDVDPLLVLF